MECAAISPQDSGPERLTVRLKEYAEQLVLDRVGKDEIKTDACGGRFPLSPIARTRDRSSRLLFVYGFNRIAPRPDGNAHALRPKSHCSRHARPDRTHPRDKRFDGAVDLIPRVRKWHKLANIRMEPTRRPSSATMSLRRAAHLER